MFNADEIKAEHEALINEVAEINKLAEKGEKLLELAQRNQSGSTALSLILLALSLFLSGRIITRLGDTFLGDYLFSLVTEIGGAFLTFWLLDSVWRTRAEEFQRFEDIISRQKHLSARYARLSIFSNQMVTRYGNKTEKDVSWADLALVVADYAVYRVLREETSIDYALLLLAMKKIEEKQKHGLLSRVRSLLRF